MKLDLYQKNPMFGKKKIISSEDFVPFEQVPSFLKRKKVNGRTIQSSPAYVLPKTFPDLIEQNMPDFYDNSWLIAGEEKPNDTPSHLFIPQFLVSQSQGAFDVNNKTKYGTQKEGNSIYLLGSQLDRYSVQDMNFGGFKRGNLSSKIAKGEVLGLGGHLNNQEILIPDFVVLGDDYPQRIYLVRKDYSKSM